MGEYLMQGGGLQAIEMFYIGVFSERKHKSDE